MDDASVVLESLVLDDALSLDSDAFSAHVQSASAPEQCVHLARTSHVIKNLWQGSFKLIEDDLKRVLPAAAAEASIAALTTAGVAAAYRLRRELVNFKKACLRLVHDLERLLLSFKRLDSYFFVDTSAGHELGLFAMPARASAARELEADRPRYEHLCGRLQRAKGVLLALRDARDFTKLLCALPRHPDDWELQSNPLAHLRRMPGSLKASGALQHAEAFLATSPALSSAAAAGEGATGSVRAAMARTGVAAAAMGAPAARVAGGATMIVASVAAGALAAARTRTASWTTGELAGLRAGGERGAQSDAEGDGMGAARRLGHRGLRRPHAQQAEPRQSPPAAAHGSQAP